MVFVVSLVSSPGAGKTAFLEKTLTVLHQHTGWRHWLAIWRQTMMLPAWPAAMLRSSGTLCHLEACNGAECA